MQFRCKMLGFGSIPAAEGKTRSCLRSASPLHSHAIPGALAMGSAGGWAGTQPSGRSLRWLQRRAEVLPQMKVARKPEGSEGAKPPARSHARVGHPGQNQACGTTSLLGTVPGMRRVCGEWLVHPQWSG